jgi:YcxB-like protein
MNFSSGPYSLTNYPWGTAQRLTLRQTVPALLRYGLWGIWSTIAAWLTLCLVAPAWGMVFGKTTPLVVAGVGLIAAFVLIRARNAKVIKALNTSPFRAGAWRAAITDEGFLITGDGVRQLVFWDHLTGVQDGPDGLLVMLGTVVFVPIPAVAFADFAAMQAFRAALGAKISGAKGAI